MLRKFFSTVAVGSLFVGGLAASHLAFAQPGADGPRGPRGGMMMQADANKDGKISKAELTTALDARFARMDVDKDGQLPSKDRDLKRQQRMDERFTKLDTDKNGQLSKTELAAGHEARADKRADMGKGEGRMGKGHHRGMMRYGGKGGAMGDANKDGTVTKAEFTAGAMAMFDKADTNKDGFVTADEMKAGRQAMRGAWKDRKAPPAQN